jgi:alkyl sulfatase BDS1-like metallo-beta-lactamase superfamily hydrolase
MYNPLRISLVLFVTAVLLSQTACEGDPLPPGLDSLTADNKPASIQTLRSNQQLLKQLPFASRTDFDRASRGFIATVDGATTTDAQGGTVFSLEAMGFLDAEAPDTVNPSLWRQAQLNALLHGLFEVVEGVYQVRSFDLANMTLIAGDTGWIIVDPLLTSETASAALALANRELGERPVSAVVITHSHVDHFGGINGVLSEQQIVDGSVPVVAPHGFSEEAFSENLRAGNVMARRALYQFGNLLENSPTGFVSSGLGNKTALGSTGGISPGILVPEEGLKLTLDGVEFEFMDAAGSEAPAGLLFYLPAFRAMGMADVAVPSMHNLYTLRGAKTRDADRWAGHIDAALQQWGDRSDVVMASHLWPVWGGEELREYLELQRDMYKFIHDQTLRLANLGYNMEEIAEQLELPEALSDTFANRGYYGTVSHGVKAVYNYYLGWFDGNPSNLEPLPPGPAAEKYVAYMGGSRAVLEKAALDFARGEYRWVAEVLRHVVFADPDDRTAQLLLADAYEQLGYQAESAIWRNFYLTGARELRDGLQMPGRESAPGAGLIEQVPLDQLVDAMSVRLDGAAAADKHISLNIELTDSGEYWLLEVKNGVLHGFAGRQSEDPSATLVIAERDLKLMLTGFVGAPALIADDRLQLEGNPLTLISFAGLFEQFEPGFNIVIP